MSEPRAVPLRAVFRAAGPVLGAGRLGGIPQSSLQTNCAMQMVRSACSELKLDWIGFIKLLHETSFNNVTLIAQQK